MGEILNRVTALSAEKRALLLQRLKQKNQENSVPFSLPGSECHNLHFCLSFGQQRFWVQEQLQPGTPTYTIPLALHLSGPLNIAALQHALQHLTHRHQSLRTRFIEQDGEPFQVIDPITDTILMQVNLSKVTSYEQESYLQEHMQRPFDLRQGPPFRATLFCLQEHEYLLLLCMHHIISDGWSINLLLRDLATFYHVACDISRTTFPPLPLQYTDFALWQRHHLQGTVLQRHLDYWTQHLHGVPTLLSLPLDHPRPNRQILTGASFPFSLSVELTSSLYHLARREGVSLFMLLLAAFQLLLAHYSGQDDIVVGTPIANRTRHEFEEIVGFFVNTLVLRTDLSGNLNIHDLLARVRSVCLEAYAHQDLPFERLVEELKPDRNPAYSPLIQVMFVLQNTPLDLPAFPDISIRLIEAQTPTSKFDLTLELIEEGEQLLGRIEYKTDLFEHETIERLAGHWQVLLQGMTANKAGQSIRNLPLLTKAERERILVQWNATQTDYPQGRTIHQLFEEQVERTPETIALVCGQDQLSYQELNRRANQLAHYLRHQGIRPEVLVGICLERSTELVIALLAVLKAGGAYVPLDPTYPSERLTFILKDAQVALVLTSSEVQQTLGSWSGKCVCMDRQDDQWLHLSADNPYSEITEHHLAYVIYTSGSTGKPKGVLIEHCSSVCLLDWANETFSSQELAGMLASTSICFDLSVFELFAPLSCGGRVILVKNVLEVRFLSDAYGITLINTVPSAITELVKLEAIPNTVLTVNLAGEALQAHLVQEIYQHSKVRRVFNLYGPSEDTTYSTSALISQNTIGIPPIGRPLPNTQLYILDNHTQLVPQGIIGELYISGAGLARGYLNRPGLTRERFVPCPFASNPQARMYRTGDLVRYLPDGQLEFIGRADQQVKIRGFRIELSEIETTLRQHYAIKDAIVLAQGEKDGSKQLVAYCIGDHNVSTLDSNDLKAHLRKQLPEYMLPASYMLLDSFPLTPNGKVDRQALPAPSWSREKIPQAYLAPRDRLELQLVRTWEDILGKKPIGVRDNFFDLGGHSLQAVRLMASLQQLLGKSFPLSVLLQGGSTIEYLAGIIRGQMELEPWSPLVKIQEGKGKYPFFAIHPSSGEVIRYVDLARLLGTDQGVYGLQAPGLYEQHETLITIENMAERYIEAIRTIQPFGPYFLGGFSLGGNIAFEMAQQLHEKGEKVAFLLLLDSANPHEKWSTLQEDAAYWCWQHDSYLPSLSIEYLRSLQADEQLDYLVEQLRHNTEAPPRFTLPNCKQFLQVQKNNVQALTRYIAQPYPGKLTLFRVVEQPEEYLYDLELGWTGLAAQGVDIYEFPGKHETILTQPILDVVARQVKECLLAAQIGIE